MVLDINLFRKERGGNPDLVLESQKRRHADVAAVERVISLDLSWRKAQSVLENLRKCVGICSKATGAKMKAAGGKPEPDDASLNTDDALLKSIPEEILSSAASGTLQQGAVMDLTIQQLKFLSRHISTNLIPSQECASSDLETERDTVLLSIGNIVHEEIPVEADERNNKVLRTFGDTARRTRYNHVDLMEMLGAMDCSDRVTHMAGGRSYVLKGPLVMMQLGLVQYAMNFLLQRGYEPFYPPFFMNKEAMSSVAQLSQFDEELYKVVGDGDPKYLIATSEQPACAYYRNTWLSEAELEKPIRMAGYSTCFRKEAGSHGRDTLGIFRVHQFDKVEQFVITSPRDGISWSVFAEMIQTAEEFYQSLGLPYRVVDIVTGALNNAAARKYDLEAWFSGSGAFRELVSCSNCTDYQSRSIGCRFGQNIRGAQNLKEHPHMLNATLCAITRTMCCICETYQTEEGIEVPSALRPYIPSCGELIRFKYDKPPSKQQQHSAATEKKE